jgi:4-hydroxy-4-methyl-2-oxoglutarate aldolase
MMVAVNYSKGGVEAMAVQEQRRQEFSGKYPLITFRIRREFPRPAQELVARFERFFVPDLSDLVGRMYTMDGSISSLYAPAPKLLGTALTVKCPPGDNVGVKKALYLVEPGDVLVIDAQGFTEWCLGGFGMLVRSIRERGLKGLVVNGAYRDVSQAREAGFPIYAKGVAPWSGPKRGPAEINVPVCCGGVIVHPGDVVVGDEDGVVVVPQDYVSRVADTLSGVALKPLPDDWDHDYLTSREAAQDEYLEDLLHEKRAVYLD